MNEWMGVLWNIQVYLESTPSNWMNEFMGGASTINIPFIRFTVWTESFQIIWWIYTFSTIFHVNYKTKTHFRPLFNSNFIYEMVFYQQHVTTNSYWNPRHNSNLNRCRTVKLIGFLSNNNPYRMDCVYVFVFDKQIAQQIHTPLHPWHCYFYCFPFIWEM